MTDILVATEAAQFQVGPDLISIVPGTTVRAGHPMLAQHPGYFKPLVPDYDWAEESKPRSAPPANPVRAADRGARTR